MIRSFFFFFLSLLKDTSQVPAHWKILTRSALSRSADVTG